MARRASPPWLSPGRREAQQLHQSISSSYLEEALVVTNKPLIKLSKCYLNSKNENVVVIAIWPLLGVPVDTGSQCALHSYL